LGWPRWVALEQVLDLLANFSLFALFRLSFPCLLFSLTRALRQTLVDIPSVGFLDPLFERLDVTGEIPLGGFDPYRHSLYSRFL
jgi:hypothetical protein